MKIVFGMIVFNGDYVLRQCLEQVYPYASQILIAEGPVTYWQQQGYTTSSDETNTILAEFPDPDNKIVVVHGQFAEKDEQCRAYMQHIKEDADYVWHLDSDEVYKAEDIERIIEFLTKERPTSVGVQSCSFYGGFEEYLTGFELKTDNFLRIFKYEKGCTWLTHRPPTIQYSGHVVRKHVSSVELLKATGAQMYHYSYVFPEQVRQKIAYYKAKVSCDNCIDNYFERVYMPWVTGTLRDVLSVEREFLGVHEFKPEVRGPCFPTAFTGSHPAAITRDLETLHKKFVAQLAVYAS